MLEHVSLQRIARLFSATRDNDSLKRLFKLVVLSVAVGSLDPTTILRVATAQGPHERARAGLAHDIAGFAASLLAVRATGAGGQPR
jgi:hypothetical protein